MIIALAEISIEMLSEISGNKAVSTVMGSREVHGLEFCLFPPSQGIFCSTSSAKHDYYSFGNSKVLNFRVRVFGRAEMLNRC